MTEGIPKIHPQPVSSPCTEHAGVRVLDKEWRLYLPRIEQTLVICVGADSDGASVPRPLWSFVGDPFSPMFEAAAWAHDFLVCGRLLGSDITLHRYWLVNKLFEDVLLLNGNSSALSGSMFTGVQIGCWRSYTRQTPQGVAEARTLCRLEPGDTVGRLDITP